MERRGRWPWVLACAVLGGLIVGPFRLQPPWFWGMLGGAVGGVLGALSAWIAARPWKWPLRILAVTAVLGTGFFFLWMLASGRFILEWIEATNPTAGR